MKTLTDLEQQVINAIRNQDNPEYFFASEILEKTGNSKAIRGAMASLVKKGIIDINNDFDGFVSILDDGLRNELNIQ